MDDLESDLKTLRELYGSRGWREISSIYMDIGRAPLHTRRSITKTMTYQVETFRGISQGWKPVGRPRLYNDAIRLRQTVALVRPEFITRTRCLSPELPAFL